MRGTILAALERGLVSARWAVRRSWLNLRPGVAISPATIVDPGARFLLQPDGWRFGGAIRVGPRCRIGAGAILAPFGGSIDLADGVYVGPYCILYGHGGLCIGANTMIAAHTVIIPANHRFDDPVVPINNQGETRLGISIGSNVWIGCGVRILDGVAIGDGCVIGAGAVVTRSLEPYCVAAGVPARALRKRTAAEQPLRDPQLAAPGLPPPAQ